MIGGIYTGGGRPLPFGNGEQLLLDARASPVHEALRQYPSNLHKAGIGNYGAG
jgi:hypothetical protein